MEDVQPKFTFGDLVGYALAYMCWIVTAAASILAMFQARNTLNVLWPVLGGSRWVLRPLDRFGLVFMGLLWLVYVIFVEQHYRSSITLVRMRRLKARTAPRDAPRPVVRPGRFTRFLRKLGLDILAHRFLPTLMLPLVLFVIVYLLQQLAFWLMGRV